MDIRPTRRTNTEPLAVGWLEDMKSIYYTFAFCLSSDACFRSNFSLDSLVSL